MKRYITIAGTFLGTFLFFYVLFSGRAEILVDLFKSRPSTSQELTRELEERHHGVSPFWLERYGASVRSEDDVLVDADGDGLTLLEEYTYFTHPFESDTDGDGYTDGEEVAKGYSPTGEGRLDINDNQLPDLWEQKYRLSGEDAYADTDTDDDGLSNGDEFLYGTSPRDADTDGDGYGDGKEVTGGYDPVAAGDTKSRYHIIIDRINIDAPIVLSQDAAEEVLQKDLEYGVIHYPGMAIPGKRGNSYIAGHSSNYSWSRGNFNTIFKDLVDVLPGDAITVTETLANGKEVRHRYVVSLQEEVEADDNRIFENSQSSILTLTTCWPLGTADRRIMVKAHLVDTGEHIVYNDGTKIDDNS